MITLQSIDWISFGIGAGVLLVFVLFLYIVIPRRKPKHTMKNLKQLVYDAGIKTKEVYEILLELEKFFKEVENIKNEE